MKTKTPGSLLFLVHWLLLGLLLINALSWKVFDFSFAQEVTLIGKVLLMLSGLILFMLYLKPFKKVNWYFSIYPISLGLALYALLIRGILGAIILSIFLAPFHPAMKEFEQDGIVVSTPYEGFMSPCCTYQVKERKWLFFEKRYKEFSTEGAIKFETMVLKAQKEKVHLLFSTQRSDSVFTIIIKS